MPALTPFELIIQSLTPPNLPPVPPGLDPSKIKSSLIPNELSPTTPLYFTAILPSARPKDPLFPASHLQMLFRYKGTGEVSSVDWITARDMQALDDPGVYRFEIKPRSVLRVKVNHGESPDAEVLIRAWREDKFLGVWLIGRIGGLGLEGLKSEPIHLARVEHWEKTRSS